MQIDTDINILFLGGSRRVSVGEIFIRTGKEMGKRINIFSYELNKNEPIAAIGTILPGLQWKDAQIADHLSSTIQAYSIHIVVPFVDIATIICADLREKMPDVMFCVSGKDICEAMFDKAEAQKWFTGKNILVPSLKETPPLVAKLTTGSGAKGMHFLRTKAELEFFLANFDKSKFFIQELIEGEEFSVDCYVDKTSEVISMVPRKRLEVINGEASKSVTVRDEAIVRESRSILKKDAFMGPVTIQFMREKGTERLYLLEINPRLGSGVLTSIAAGANICQYILNDYLNIPNQPEADWKENLLMVRAFKEFYFDATNN